MQDRFKFRVWDKKEKRFINFDDFKKHGIEFNFDIKSESIRIKYNKTRYDVIQCTGLKDKHGKLIYEGDIVVDDEGDKAIIEYNNLHACFQFNFGDDYREFGESDVDIEQCKIIGNIYENPGLLE